MTDVIRCTGQTNGFHPDFTQTPNKAPNPAILNLCHGFSSSGLTLKYAL